MKVSELRIIHNDFMQILEPLAAELQLLNIEFQQLLVNLSDKDDVNPKLGEKVREMLISFWQEMCQRPISNDWETNPIVIETLKFQTLLHSQTGWPLQKAHHVYFYHHLALQYSQEGNENLSLEKFIPVILQCCRMIGYAEKENDENYPFTRLSAISKTAVLHEIGKRKAIITAMNVIFYLLYHHCTVNQGKILINLIKYRPHTTDEEMRSESALLAFLYHQPEKSLALFEQLKLYIDGREFSLNEHLKNLRHLIPVSKQALINATIYNRGYYIITSGARHTSPDVLNELSRALTSDFNEQTDHSYEGALTFTKTVRKKFENLPLESKNKLSSALNCFCYEKYVEMRQQQPVSNSYFSFFSFSGDTKCRAAKKLQQQERGESSSLSFIEAMASRQGRLRALVSSLEQYKQEDRAQLLKFS